MKTKCFDNSDTWRYFTKTVTIVLEQNI